MPDIGLSLNTNLRQQQEQQLAPAQLQGLEILQATNLELQQRVSQALMQNPILEQVNQPLTINEDDALREMRQRSPDAEDIRAARDFDGDAQEYRAEAFAQAAESVPEQMPSYDSDGEAIPANEVEEPEYRGLRSTADDEYYPVVSRDPDAEERRKFLLDSVPSEDGYYTKLLRQVAVLQVPQPVRELCAKLVGELNERGYLKRSDEELAEEYQVSIADIRRAVKALQSLEPPGIGARNLRECLLLQLKAQRLVHSLEWDIVYSHLEDVAANRIPQIAKAIDADEDETKEAIERIRELNPAPGYEVSFDFAAPIYPDVYVEFDENNNLQVRMAQDTVPILRMNSDYLRMLGQKSSGDSEGLKDLEDSEELESPEEPEEPEELEMSDAEQKEVRKFLLPKYKEAKQLIDAIAERQRTIERITLMLVALQSGYFHSGDEGELHPLTLAKVADRLDLAESTVSRAISNKYIRTPWGTRSFKSFFPAGIRTASGEEVSNLKALQRIRELVAAEDKRHPLSDQAISDQLKSEGYKVERRTVVKYRDMAQIPTSSQRKTH
ncbi:MAG: hypothetical protein J5654_10805 [Victivallales bacterium]|nr:hypothetical protein [Victivallales bacterium]